MASIGVVLAGGHSSRMGGGHKFLRVVEGRTILDWVIGRLRPQVDLLIVSAAPDSPAFEVDFPIVRDEVANAGPLGGIHAAAQWAARTIGEEARMVTMPADTPFIPLDLVSRLAAASVGDPRTIAVAASASRRHHAIASWPVRIANELGDWLLADERRSIHDFLEGQVTRTVAFDGDVDPFFNVNTPDDLEQAALMARRLKLGP